MPAGRPSKYTQELADQLCERLSQGKSLRTVCKAEDMPSAVTIFSWLRKDPEFLKQYERSKAEAADSLADEILDIADNSVNDYMAQLVADGDEEAIAAVKLHPENIQRSRLRVDARKWIASKLKPKKYGDKMNIGGDPDNPIRTSLQIEFVDH